MCIRDRLLSLLNVKTSVALSEDASRTRYTVKIQLKLRKWVSEKKGFQLSFERREWAGWSDNRRQWNFAVLVPTTWNSLPLSLCTPELSLSIFKRLLKTQLFQHAWTIIRRRCDWTASLAPHTNIQTQLNSDCCTRTQLQLQMLSRHCDCYILQGVLSSRLSPVLTVWTAEATVI